MGYTVSELLRIAAAEIGYKEKETNSQLDDKTANAGDNNWTKYARDLQKAGYYQAGKNGYAWCDMFVDWCFLQLCGGDKTKAEDMICQTGLYGAGCEWSAKYYRQQGRFFTSGPMPGDQIFFNDYAHTGIVEKIEGGKVHTIEGNTSNMVARRTYTLGSSSIDGYGRPKYDAEAEQAPAPVFPTYTAGKDNEHTIFNFLTEIMGLNTAAACGVLANIEHESSFNPTVYGDSGTSYGICQWHNTRFTALKNYCGQIGKEYTTLDGQLWYLKNELESGYKSVLAGIKAVPNTAEGAYEAGYIWCVKFEIPANKEQRGVTRGNTAKEYFAKYTNATMPETPVTPEKPIAPVAELPEVGQIVSFEGTIHYISSNAKKGVKCKPGKAKVTNRNKGAAHPVHLVKVSGGGSTVYGWVDLADITVIHTPAATIGEGSKVKIKEGSVYGGLSRTRGKAVPGWVCKRILTIVDIAEHHGVKEARLQEINSWVAVASLTLA